MGRLQDKVALIMGAGSVGPGWGNGRAMAVRFAQEGASLYATDLSLQNLQETIDRVQALNGHIQSAACDVTNHQQIEQTVKDCLKAYGRIDILVNNVGGSAAGGPVEMSEEVWDSQVDRNLKSVFLACKHVLPIMQQQGSGAIINIASTSGIRWTGSAQVAYAATKAGVIQLSRVVAVQYAPDNIRVNTIVPGQLHTPMVETRLAGQRLVATLKPSWRSAKRAYLCPSWVTAPTPPTPLSFSPAMRLGL